MISYVYAVFGAFAIPVLLYTFCVAVVRIIENS